MKTLKILFPEWQGYGIDSRVAEGARSLRDAFSPQADFIEIKVPAAERLVIDDGILGRSSLVRNARSMLAQVEAAQPDRILMIGGWAECRRICGRQSSSSLPDSGFV